MTLDLRPVRSNSELGEGCQFLGKTLLILLDLGIPCCDPLHLKYLADESLSLTEIYGYLELSDFVFVIA